MNLQYQITSHLNSTTLFSKKTSTNESNIVEIPLFHCQFCCPFLCSTRGSCPHLPVVSGLQKNKKGRFSVFEDIMLNFESFYPPFDIYKRVYLHVLVKNRMHCKIEKTKDWLL